MAADEAVPDVLLTAAVTLLKKEKKEEALTGITCCTTINKVLFCKRRVLRCSVERRAARDEKNQRTDLLQNAPLMFSEPRVVRPSQDYCCLKKLKITHPTSILTNEL